MRIVVLVLSWESRPIVATYHSHVRCLFTRPSKMEGFSHWYLGFCAACLIICFSSSFWVFSLLSVVNSFVHWLDQGTSWDLIRWRLVWSLVVIFLIILSVLGLCSAKSVDQDSYGRCDRVPSQRKHWYGLDSNACFGCILGMKMLSKRSSTMNSVPASYWVFSWSCPQGLRIWNRNHKTYRQSKGGLRLLKPSWTGDGWRSLHTLAGMFHCWALPRNIIRFFWFQMIGNPPQLPFKFSS